MTGVALGVLLLGSLLVAWDLVDEVRHRRRERRAAQWWAVALREHLAAVSRTEEARQAWVLESYRQ